MPGPDLAEDSFIDVTGTIIQVDEQALLALDDNALGTKYAWFDAAAHQTSTEWPKRLLDGVYGTIRDGDRVTGLIDPADLKAPAYPGEKIFQLLQAVRFAGGKLTASFLKAKAGLLAAPDYAPVAEALTAMDKGGTAAAATEELQSFIQARQRVAAHDPAVLAVAADALTRIGTSDADAALRAAISLTFLRDPKKNDLNDAWMLGLQRETLTLARLQAAGDRDAAARRFTTLAQDGGDIPLKIAACRDLLKLARRTAATAEDGTQDAQPGILLRAALYAADAALNAPAHWRDKDKSCAGAQADANAAWADIVDRLIVLAPEKALAHVVYVGDHAQHDFTDRRALKNVAIERLRSIAAEPVLAARANGSIASLSKELFNVAIEAHSGHNHGSGGHGAHDDHDHDDHDNHDHHGHAHDDHGHAKPHVHGAACKPH